MKTRTRVLAWLYILPQVPALVCAGVLVVAFLLFGTGIATGLVKAEHASLLGRAVASFGLTFLSVIVAVLALLGLLPWIYLLKKRAWAWWLLTITFALLTVCIAPSARENVLASVVVGATLLVLLTDRPSMWKGKSRISGRKRRR